MTDHLQQHAITQCRIQARRLLKQLRSSQPEEAACAADRFRELRSFSSFPVSEVLELVKQVQLKHALALVVQERGYESWGALKRAHERPVGATAQDSDKPEAPSIRRGPEKADAADLEWSGPVELVALSVKERAARCRPMGSDSIVTLRASRIWHVVPAEIVAVRPRKQWRYKGHSYLSGEIESTRLDVTALGLRPLELEHEGIWDPDEHYWGEQDEPIEEWAKPIMATGPRSEFRMERVTPGEDPDDAFSDPIIEAADLKDAGNYKEAHKILMNICEADLRCLDAHAHLGNLAFDHAPKDAIRHYAVGLGIGELSLRKGFDGVLPWGYIDNRPFLRCLHGYGLCLWRLGRFDEAEQVFTRMLWLNPSDNQGARFLIQEVRARIAWPDLYAEKSLS